MESPSAQPLRSTGARVLGSLVGTGMGWIAVFLLLLGWIALGEGGNALRGTILALALATAAPVFGIWLLVLLPLTLLVSPDSIFWRPPICALTGVLAGTVLALLLSNARGLGVVGGISGGIVFLAAALSVRRLR